MAVAFVADNPHGSQESYDKVGDEMALEGRPAGQIVHFAGPGPDGGWRVVDVWESEEAAERFFEDHLGPALRALGLPLDGERPRFFPVHNYIG